MKKNKRNDRLPLKRKLIQLYAALLFNANIKGFIGGKIYTGNTKTVCTPGLNCYSCPGAVGACPLGALQNSLAASGKTAPYYVFGILMLYGLFFGRWICGYLCPFGLIQELLHKIPTPKLKKSRFTRALSVLKYFILAFFVVIVPIAYMVKDFPLPGFCKYICPAGTLEGALGLLSNKANEGFLRMLGPIFTWKFMLLVSFLVACVFIFRMFCRFICPLGALYGFFNRISLIGVKVEKKSCIDCGLCVDKCKMDIKRVGDAECINCGECISSCPTGAIVWKGGRAMIIPEETLSVPEGSDAARAEELRVENEKKNQRIRRRNNAVRITVGVIMAAVLAAALIYYNFIDGRETEPPTPEPPVATETEGANEPLETEVGGESESGAEGSLETESETEQGFVPPPVGVDVGYSCPDFSIDLVDGSSVRISDMRGRVTVLNFWFTTCGPCIAELPHFNTAAESYGELVEIIAIHLEIKGTDVEAWVGKNYPEWLSGEMLLAWDTGRALQTEFGIQACPVTVVIDGNGVITDLFSGSLTPEELEGAIDKAVAQGQ